MKSDLDYNINNMATIKSYTDLEQSKKLAEILPIESADMWYSIVDNEAFICLEHHDEYKQIPCWSLSALLKVMPFWYDIHPVKNGVALKCDYGKEEIVISDNHIDACVEMIIKLNKLNLL